MTINLDSDFKTHQAGKTLPLAFESSAAELAGIRLLPAQFARLLGVSKQCLTEWKKAGRVTLGADGRLDPRQAVAQLLRTGDPARLRSKILAPLMQEVTRRDRRIAELETALASASEEAEFHEGSALELLQVIDSLKFHLELNWGDLLALPASEGLPAVLAWIDVAMVVGADPGPTILDFALAARSDGEREGAGIVPNRHD